MIKSLFKRAKDGTESDRSLTLVSEYRDTMEKAMAVLASSLRDPAQWSAPQKEQEGDSDIFVVQHKHEGIRLFMYQKTKEGCQEAAGPASLRVYTNLGVKSIHSEILDPDFTEDVVTAFNELVGYHKENARLVNQPQIHSLVTRLLSSDFGKPKDNNV